MSEPTARTSADIAHMPVDSSSGSGEPAASELHTNYVDFADPVPDASAIGASSTAEPGAAGTATALPPDVVRRSLRASVLDGTAWAVMVGAGERYLVPLVVLSNLSMMQLAALATLPLLAGSIVQCAAADVVDRYPRRRRLLVASGVSQALTWLPVCVALFLPINVAYWVMLVSYAFYLATIAVGQPAWTSLMGELVPPDRRGRYFGMRNCLNGAAVTAAFLLAGEWLTWSENRPSLELFGLSSQYFGFLMLFALALVARLISSYFLWQMHDPPYNPKPHDRFSLWQFTKRAPQAQFGRFVIYRALIQLGGGVIGPFLAAFMLSEMGLSPAAYAWVWALNLAAIFAAQPLFGRLADRFGTKRLLEIGGVAITIIPLLLLVSSELWYLCVVMVYDGLAWALFNICAANYLFDIVTPPKRARCSAYTSLYCSTGNLIGTLGAGAIATYVVFPLNLGGWEIKHAFTILLVLSFITRLVPNVLLLWSFNEVRVKATSPVHPGAFPGGIVPPRPGPST